MRASHLPNTLRILTINSGSSSLKFAIYDVRQSLTLVLLGGAERIGLRASRFYIKNVDNEIMTDQLVDLPDHDSALNALFEWLQDHGQDLDAVGHRVVHGGPDYTQPHLVTPDVVETLKALTPLAPDHLPHELRAIQGVSRSYPQLPQVVCFDTAFHRHMPDVAQIYALPRHYRHEGILRYGFHGLSYEYILQELQSEAGPKAASGRVIIAHLGNGASMAAIRQGQSVDTTMGLTPAGGLVMGTRAGDLDPGVILYLIEEKGIRPSSVEDMLNQHSGLLGVSGMSSDMKDLLNQAALQPHAAEAVALFCYQAKKFLGALCAVLGGLDTLIFTGGIGENAPAVRQRMCEGLEFLGIYLDMQLNAANASIISRNSSPVTVRVMETDEELMIAKHTYDLIKQIRSGDDDTAHSRGSEQNRRVLAGG